MLDTLNRYVQGSPGSSRSGLQDWRPGAGLDRRWPAIITLSVAGHLVFFIALVALDWWIYHTVIARRPVENKQALSVVLLAYPDRERTPLRAAPERLESIDPRHMKFEIGSDDTKLLPRSPTPAVSTAPGTRQAGRGPDQRAQSRSPGGRPDRPAASNRTDAQPPGSRSIQAPEVSALQSPAPATLPVSPSGQPPAPPSPDQRQSRAGHDSGQSGDDAGRSSRIGLRAAQSQYVAYVRRKIYTENQRIMPRGWIETVLAGEVVSEFSLILDRNGRVKTVRLVQSCGYSTLDRKAREAISLASPFEGFPPELGDSFEMTVDVHYTPFH